MDRILATLQLHDETSRIARERKSTENRLKRLGTAFVDGLYAYDDYQREKNTLDQRIAGLVSPDQETALRAGKLLEDLPSLWERANLVERRTLLMAMLDSVYVDAKDEKRVVAIRPKPAFQSLFCMALMKEGSGVVMTSHEPEGDESFIENKTTPPGEIPEGVVSSC